MKRSILFCLCLSVSSIICADDKTATVSNPQQRNADEQAPGDQPTSYWMKKKLEYSQAVLRGFATADFDDIKFNAGRLNLLNRVEGFVRRRNPEYRIHPKTFNRVTQEIAKQAEQKNIEGAAFAFNQLASSCVECHKSMRAEEQ